MYKKNSVLGNLKSWVMFPLGAACMGVEKIYNTPSLLIILLLVAPGGEAKTSPCPDEMVPHDPLEGPSTVPCKPGNSMLAGQDIIHLGHAKCENITNCHDPDTGRGALVKTYKNGTRQLYYYDTKTDPIVFFGDKATERRHKREKREALEEECTERPKYSL